MDDEQFHEKRWYVDELLPVDHSKTLGIVIL